MPKYSKLIKKWWQGYTEFKDCFVHDLRDKFIIQGLLTKPFKFIYNGAGFKNDPKLNTKWLPPEELGWDVILFAPVLRREILPSEILIELDIENRQELIRRASWIKAALESLEIEYTLGFSGNRGFHFHIIIDPYMTIPSDLPDGFSLDQLRKAVFNKVIELSSPEGVDCRSSGLFGRHLVREFFSINHKTLAYKIPVKELEIKFVTFPDYPKVDWDGYQFWKPSKQQMDELIQEIQETLKAKESIKRMISKIWSLKPKKSRTIGSRWRVERIAKYAEALKRYGRLTKDPEIAQRHDNEHYARVHLILLMLEECWSDEQIHDVFRFAEDYNEKRTQYFINYNRKKIKGKKA